MSKTTPASDRSLWPGSTWERACRELFDGDRGRMAAWGRRYLAAYPDVHGEAFHLGAPFRRIVGARNRLHWWRTALELLAEKTNAVATAGQVSETVVEYGAAPIAAEERMDTRAAERLRIFDMATARQRRRERGLPVAEPSAAAAARGWTRDELHERTERAD